VNVATESDESLRSVIAALAANCTIAVAKGIAAALTGSAALLAETLHTVADTTNEILLWISVRRSARPADPSHPFGYGPERYYWALLAAVGMFVIGGMVSIWRGVTALIHPTDIEAFWVGVGVLIISIVLDSSSRFVATRTLAAQARRDGITRSALLRENPDPAVTTIYLEDTIDVLGAFLALVALVLHRVLGWSAPDALASLAIGGLLTYVAIRLASRNRAMLSNQAIPERLTERLRERLVQQPGITGVGQLEAIYLGPREALAAAEVSVEDGDIATTLEIARATMCGAVPGLTRLYLTPVHHIEPAAEDQAAGRSPTQ
jgi:cation diffusion facilitator family transporter